VDFMEETTAMLTKTWHYVLVCLVTQSVVRNFDPGQPWSALIWAVATIWMLASLWRGLRARSRSWDDPDAVCPGCGLRTTNEACSERLWHASHKDGASRPINTQA
jgi:hypothetical protein